MTDRRLIEAAFPLNQVSLDSVHEKNVRHGHISTLHVWPARRPLAASRAALLATLLPDPGDAAERRKLLDRLAGRVEKVPNRTGDGTQEATRGGILHWGRESTYDGQAELARFRDEIRAAYGGRAPRVLDPFAGGGAIPLEAMRLGCEAVAADLNPVAWFILRCTLHYPQRLAGQTLALPKFALRERDFAEAFLKARGVTAKGALRDRLARLGHGGDDAPAEPALDFETDAPPGDADFAWHLRAWGRRVLARGRRDLAARYPTYADFEPVRRKGRRRNPRPETSFHPRPARLLQPNDQGVVSPASLNAEFDSLYLEDGANPRWVAKPPVAYLWARTVRCSGCRAEIPLLKTLWLCKKPRKRVLLTLQAGAAETGVTFGIEQDVPDGSGSPAQKREHDRKLGSGTMSASGATCPCCGIIATTSDIRARGRLGRLGERMTAVIVEGQRGKEYRLPTEVEVQSVRVTEDELADVYQRIPFGLPDEPISPERPSPNSRGASGLPRYGFDTWRRVFTNRQLLALATFINAIRRCRGDLEGYSETWREAIFHYLACAISKLTDYSSAICSWNIGRELIRNTFARFALPMVWDYCEVNPTSTSSGGFAAMMEWVVRYVDHATSAMAGAPPPIIRRQSAIDLQAEAADEVDVICTDPPYYDAIPYSDLIDFFHVWLRRVLSGQSSEADATFADRLGPKWDHDRNDGELVDQPGRFDLDGDASRSAYEDGMFRVFRNCRSALRDAGRLVVVFANKQPEAWETLVSALIRAGFVVDASWPIQTEMQNKVAGGARLSASIWLVCRKRPAAARPGWDSKVLTEMQENITARLRDFWDAGVRGPDFVWAATGPALEAFSRHPVVKRADSPGKMLTVAAFLRRVRRMVVGFVVSRLLDRESAAAGELDDLTTYYLLHRNDFGLGAAPAGACILYAISCNLSDADLAGRLDLLIRGGRSAPTDEDAESADAVSGSEAQLKPWHRRRARDLGEPAGDGSAPPLIDCVHKVMQHWKTGEQSRVDAYLEARGLWRHELFARVVQAVLELAERGTDERAALESLQNHLQAHTGSPTAPQGVLWPTTR